MSKARVCWSVLWRAPSSATGGTSCRSMLQGPFWSPQEQMSSAQPELIQEHFNTQDLCVFSKRALAYRSLQKQSWGPQEQ